MKEIHICNKEGSAGTDGKVPTKSKPEILTWVHARTEEVQNSHQIAAINTVILTENLSNETSEGSGKPVAKNGTLIVKGHLEYEHPPIQGRSWSLVP